MAIVCLSAMHACKHSGRDAEGVFVQTTVALVAAELQLDAESRHFDYGVLTVNLYEYDQRLADVAARLVDSRKIEVNYLANSEPFSMTIALGTGITKKEHKTYYLVANIQNSSGVRTHYGYKKGTRGPAKIVEDSRDVKVLLREIARHQP